MCTFMITGNTVYSQKTESDRIPKDDWDIIVLLLYLWHFIPLLFTQLEQYVKKLIPVHWMPQGILEKQHKSFYLGVAIASTTSAPLPVEFLRAKFSPLFSFKRHYHQGPPLRELGSKFQIQI